MEAQPKTAAIFMNIGFPNGGLSPLPSQSELKKWCEKVHGLHYDVRKGNTEIGESDALIISITHPLRNRPYILYCKFHMDPLELGLQEMGRIIERKLNT